MTHPQTQDDEALVEVMARAMFIENNPGDDWDDEDVQVPAGSIVALADRLRRSARAALTALRNHEGRKG
jgi:hypothetical protein